MITVSGKKAFRKSLYDKKSIPKKAITAVVKKEIAKEGEWHFYQDILTANFNSVGNTWSELDLCPLISEGDDVSNRTGREIKIGSILIEGTYSAGAQLSIADDAYNTMRIVVATWKGATGSTPLQSSGVSLHTAIMHNSVGGNILGKVHLDKYLTCNTTGQGLTNGYVPELKTFKYYKRFKNPIVVRYSSSAGTYPDTKLMIAMISDSSAVVNPGFVAGRYIMKFLA